jgi:hypothetical protein
LDTDHRFRFQARSFDGTQELRERPILLSGHEIYGLTKGMKTVFAKTQKTKKSNKRKDNGDEEGDERDISSVFKKRGCLFQFPYWETLLLRHNFNFMHIQKMSLTTQPIPFLLLIRNQRTISMHALISRKWAYD